MKKEGIMNKIKKVLLIVLCSSILFGATSFEVQAASFVIPDTVEFDTGLYETLIFTGFIVQMYVGQQVYIDSINYADNVALGYLYVYHCASSKIGYCDAHAYRL